MSKKIIAVAAAIILTAIAVVGGTLAWFTDSKTATNVITMGDLAIELTETGGGPIDEDGTYGLTIENIMPGDTIEKDPTIKNVSTSQKPAYVRVKFEVLYDPYGNIYGGLKEVRDVIVRGFKDVVIDAFQAQFGAAFDTTWLTKESDDDEWYYYSAPLAYGVPVALFKTLEIPTTFGNIYQNRSVGVVITVQAVQVANNGTDVLTAEGWGE